MLKNRYQEILVGLNLMSLVRGVISLRRNQTTLLIDDNRFLGESYPLNFLSEIEVMALLRLGKTYEIPELMDLRSFLLQASFEFVTKETRLRLGASPFENLREILRKFPELIEAAELDQVFAEAPEKFNQYFLEELKRYEALSFESSVKAKVRPFDLQGPKWLKTLYQRFGEMLNREYVTSKDLKYSGLLHLLSLSAEEKLKTCLAPEEVPFYFFRLLSPIYRLQDFFLTAQLKRRLLLLGGDYKDSTIQYWQFHEKKFENLLLSSFEGVITGQRVLFFSHLPEDVPFKVKSPYPLFRKTQMAPVKRASSPFPPTQLTFLTHNELLGSERPYRVLASEKEMAYYHWPYPELAGSKAQFYEKAILASFDEDAALLPFRPVSSLPKGVLSMSLDMRQVRTNRKKESSILTRLPLEVASEDQVIGGFEYWGPFRYRSLGLVALCYGVEEN